MICKGLEIRIHFVLMTIGTLEPGCISMGCPEKSWILFSLFFSKKKIEQIFSFFEQTENLYLYLMRMNRFQFNKFVFMTKKKRKEKKNNMKKIRKFSKSTVSDGHSNHFRSTFICFLYCLFFSFDTWPKRRRW